MMSEPKHDERTEVPERAYAIERTVMNERASGCERTISGERAVVCESAVKPEQAAAQERTIQDERAVDAREHPEFTERSPEAGLRELMNDIGRRIGGVLKETVKNTGEQYGFALLMFGLKGEESSRMNYIANVNREDMLAAMKEFIARNEGRYEQFDFTRKRQ